jgi:Kinesin motor domain
MQSISSTVLSCVAGHDSTIMTYGQTGSGKTHTVLGDMLPGGDGEGVVGRTVQMLFQVIFACECWLACDWSMLQAVRRPQKAAEDSLSSLQELSASGDEFTVSMSVVEIYCERIRSASARAYYAPFST